MLNSEHWDVWGHKQRMLASEWEGIVLDGGDGIIFQGELYDLAAYDVGCGVVEVCKVQEGNDSEG